MAVVDLGQASTFSNVQTVALTCTNAVSSGLLVVVFVEDFNGTFAGTSVTDSKSNSYLAAVSNFTFGVGNICSAMWYSFITTPLTTSDTITYHAAAGFGANGMGIGACSATGYSAVDSATANSANGNSASFTVAGLGPAAVANEIYFAHISANNPLTITGIGSWSTAPPNGTPFTNTAAYQINSGTSALTCSGTLTAQQWVALITSFQPTGGAVVVPSNIIGIASAEW